MFNKFYIPEYIIVIFFYYLLFLFEFNKWFLFLFLILNLFNLLYKNYLYKFILILIIIIFINFYKNLFLFNLFLKFSFLLKFIYITTLIIYFFIILFFKKKYYIYKKIFYKFYFLIIIIIFLYKIYNNFSNNISFPINNIYEIYLIFILIKVFIYFFFYYKFNLIILEKFFFIFFNFNFIFFIFKIFGNYNENSLNLILNNFFIKIHVPLMLFSYSFLNIFFIINFVLIFKDYPYLEYICYKFCLISFFLFTLGNITGSFWAKIAWGGYWNWDPKEIWSLILWLLLIIWLHISKTNYNRKKKFFFSIIIFFIFFFLFLGINIFYNNSFHIYSNL